MGPLYSSPLCGATGLSSLFRVTGDKVGSYKSSGVHKLLEIHGKGGKKRIVPVHKQAEERLEAWLDAAGIREEQEGRYFGHSTPHAATARPQDRLCPKAPQGR
jgi:site-specific recombinase XerC